MQATVLNIQRMSTEDGPGIRTTVFFTGCQLACAWCHNPESISKRPRTVWSAHLCIGCGSCDQSCENGALHREAERVWPDPVACKACGACADACPTAALEVLGRTWSVDELVAEVEKDRAYFEESSGGVTASGGDPLVQADFAEAFLSACQQAGLHTALDTCGACPTDKLLSAAAVADLVLLDLKDIDPVRHALTTGRKPQIILDNARALAGGLSRKQRLWIRTPLIPGATARADNVAGLGRFIAEELGGRVERWELLAFNNLCREQYSRLGQTWDFAKTALMSPQELDQLTEVAMKSGVDPDIVFASGPTREEVP